MRYVLFVCNQNAGRSQMAQAFFERYAPEGLHAESAGNEPIARIHPVVLEAMAEVGIDLSGRRPQLLTRAMAARADVVVTMGCGDACPVYPGKHYEDWHVDDPDGQPLDAVRAIRDDISDHVRTLVELLTPATTS